MKQVHIIISGRVQGVFFRDFVHKQANKLGVTGWVKNKDDGTVEVVAEGEEEQLQELITACNKGPLIAKVTDEDVKWSKATDEFDGFEVRY